MTPLVRYQTALLLRSQRWLAPFLLFVALLGIGVRGGEPVLGSLGYASAPLVPVTAWLVRVCLTQEPPAARTVTAAAAGRERAHLAAVLAAAGCMTVLAVVSTAVVTAIGAATSADSQHPVPRLPAGLAGLVTAAVCVLVGVALGALGSRPLVRGRGWSTAVIAVGSLLTLVTPGSPARYAVTALVTGSHTGTAEVPWLALPGAAAVAAGAVAVVCRLTAWRD